MFEEGVCIYLEGKENFFDIERRYCLGFDRNVMGFNLGENWVDSFSIGDRNGMDRREKKV